MGFVIGACLAFFVACGFSPLPVWAESAESSTESPAQSTDLIEQADQLYAVRTSTFGAPEALALLDKHLEIDPASAATLWKAARACYWIADYSASKKKKIQAFERGIAYAKRAVELEPRSVEAHFWLAGLYGSYGEAKGIMKSLTLLKPIREELHTVNRLNDRYQGGAGYRILGVVDYKVPGFAGGSKKRALEQLNKALAIDATNAFNHYYAAEFFATAGNNKAKAREHLEILKTLTTNADVDLPDLTRIQLKGEKLLDQIGT